MKRLLLVDGNNLLFRSYYATAYNGNFMKNSKGFPTNALYGFLVMINKIIEKDEAEYMLVAFDKGKSFRHEEYKDYKAGRMETPNELLMQMPLARDLLKYMGIKYYEVEGYEADDILGTAVKLAAKDDDFVGRIVSSDRDLLQLINFETDVKLLKQKDFIIYDKETFIKDYGIEPIKVIDLKALEGDASDNIPGVKGVGEKTALSLLQKYGDLDGVYNHLDEISAGTRKKLESDKENAYFSKKLATIYTDVSLPFSLEDCKLGTEETDNLNKLLIELEFNSFLKTRENVKENKDVQFKIIDKKSTIKLNDAAYFVEMDNLNYHKADIVGVSAYDGENAYYFTKNGLLENKDIINRFKYTYDYKKNIVLFDKYDLKLNSEYDDMISSYLLELNIKDDIAYIMNSKEYSIKYLEDIIKSKSFDESLYKESILKSVYIFENKDNNLNKLATNEMKSLYEDIEFPLIEVLANMEIEGIKVSDQAIEEERKVLNLKKEDLTNKIYDFVGHEFNISSPKQLGEVLFEELNLPSPKKKGGKFGYSTNHDVLVKLKDASPIIGMILEYRNVTKLLNTYVEALPDFILSDGKIHTIYKQAVTRTGRLSSVEPNLQNIPVRSEEGKEIRKLFIPNENSVLLSSDYSQIELRILAHISKSDDLIKSFNNGEDIHTKVASDIFDKSASEVTPNERRIAKSVIFGIVYGISGFGLSENLDISTKEAKMFIDKYLTLYPGVKDYMDNIVKEAKECGYVRTLFGRKRTIEELSNANYIIRSQGERIALNTPIQGTAADIIKKAMIEVYNELNEKKLKSKMILQIHDELVLNVYNDEIEIVKDIIKKVMENAYKLSVPLIAEVNTGVNLADAK